MFININGDSYNLLFRKNTNLKMMNLGIIGHPLKHSYSKKIFNAKYLKTKIKYENYEFKKLNKIREFKKMITLLINWIYFSGSLSAVSVI